MHFTDLEQEMSSICEDGTVCLTEAYPDSPNMSLQNGNSLVWGDDIIFTGHGSQSQDIDYEDDRQGSSSCSSGPSIIDEDDKQALHRQLMDANQGPLGNMDNNKLNVTGNIVTLTDLHVEMLEPDIGLADINFFAQDEEVEDLEDICNSLELGGAIETESSTIQEIKEEIIIKEKTGTREESPSTVVKVRTSLRRTRNASRRSATDDTISFCSQADSSQAGSRTGRRRNSSEHSLVSYSGSYDDPDSPYNNSKRSQKRRRYEEDPSDDPAFEKSRKNAIIAKRNREKKKQLMELMEVRCDKLTVENEELNSDNGKLRHRVKNLEEEVFYLKSVLANQSSLSNVLSTLNNVDQQGSVRFSSSFDSNKYKKNAANQPQVDVSSGGICLHVDGNQVSIEMCAKCAQMACGKGREAVEESCGRKAANNRRSAS